MVLKALRRSFLYVPATEFKKLSKIQTLNADCFCLDIEDAVASEDKPKAR